MLDLGHYFFYIYESRCIYKCGVCICTEKYLIMWYQFCPISSLTTQESLSAPPCSHHFDQQTFTYPGEILLRKKKIAIQSILSFVNTPNPPIILKFLIKIQIQGLYNIHQHQGFQASLCKRRIYKMLHILDLLSIYS